VFPSSFQNTPAEYHTPLSCFGDCIVAYPVVLNLTLDEYTSWALALNRRFKKNAPTLIDTSTRSE
jgi:hypothetical protein